VISAAKLEKICISEVVGYVIQVHMLHPSDNNTLVHSTPSTIQRVLEQFDDVFADKQGLPPQRAADHQIPLKEGSWAPNIKPYRIPHKQKNEVEKLIKSMLQDGIIRTSNSPYSSLAILVRKKDESWRLCIDYRELNSHTIKDKFPISVIEDLLDELFGAKVFNK
jgi:hypothetical protein